MNKTYVRCIALFVILIGGLALGLLVNLNWLLVTAAVSTVGMFFLDGIEENEIEVVLREED